MKTVEMIGKLFGRLTVIEKAKSRGEQFYWKCRCVCGNIRSVRGGNLRNGHTQSCGCLHKEKTKAIFTTHGMSYASIYNVWSMMRKRCGDLNDPRYSDYGGRGITVCDSWRNSFKAFYQDMGERPKGLTLDRINNNKGYFKTNCRWATLSEQARNRRCFARSETGVTGVTWRSDCQKYRVGISINKKTYCVGHFATLKQAAEARKEAEQKYWGKGDIYA